MSWLSSVPALFFENARLVDSVHGERRGTLRLARGRIDGINVSPHRGDIRFDVQGSIILPGLINAHDHLELNTFPRLKFRPCYENAREWSAEMNARLDTDPVIVAARRVPLADRLFIGGLKNLLSGATTVAHHNPYHPPLRHNYPVRVVHPYAWAHSLYLEPTFAESYRRTPSTTPWMIHLAEGTDATAEAELTQLEQQGALGANTVLIHGVGLGAPDRTRVIEKHAALVWCPGSNLFMLEQTAHVQQLSNAHRLALGSDSRLTGELDLLTELCVARQTNQISGEALLRAVTADAAAILRLKGVGHIAPGMHADLIILPREVSSIADSLGGLRRAELRAVLVAGSVRVADPEFVPLLPHAVHATVDHRAKILARDIAARYARNLVREPHLELDAA